MAEVKTTDVVTYDDLRELLADRQGPTVSLYQPTQRGDVEGINAVRFKNLVGAADDRLEKLGHKGCNVTGQMRLLLERGDFWRGQLDGLAMFAGPGYLRAFRLPVTFDELVVVGDGAHITPLVPALAEQPFYVLAISQGSVRLIKVTRYGAEEVDLSSVAIPHNLDEAMRYDDFEKGNLPRHPTSRRADTGGRTLQHGHGPGEADLKNEITRYFQAVDGGITKILGAGKTPLVIAAVDYQIPIYRQVSSYPHVLEKGVEGNPDQLTAAQIAERARPLVEPLFRSRIDNDLERFGNALGHGLASCDLAETLTAAYSGRVDVLFACRGEQRWGLFDLTAGSVDIRSEPQRADVELVDLAVRTTMTRGGTTYVIDRDRMPCTEPVAALFRF